MTDNSPLASLATKIRSLELDDAEAAALSAILQRAIEADAPDVEGFGAQIGSLGFDTKMSSSRFKGTDEELQFKGTDEELQALLDWSVKRR